MPQPIIEFKNFGFQYDAQAKPTLYDINLSIYPGEKVLIVGPSGSGKSTLASCINGLVPFSYPGKSTGSLTVAGLDAPHSSLFELSRHVGTVLQDPDGQFIGLTVGEDIAFALENDQVPGPEMHRIVEQVADLVDLKNYLHHAPHALSGGQKQRVSLAGVMVDDVEILLFDEPLANLDPATGKQTIELIEAIQKRSNATVVIIEHRLEDVLWRKVDRIVLVADGRIVADARPDDLLAGKLLREHGIREPLYLTALKYAGVDITPQMHPAYLDTIQLTEQDKQKVKGWYHAVQQAEQPMEKPVLLQVENLTFGYEEGQTNLEDASFSVRQGEMVSIVGRNGAGKSTLSKLICGFETPRSGRIFINGRDVSGDTIKERAAHVGYVMQNPNQMISKPMIWDEVELGLLQTDLTPEERKERVEQTLKICGLYPFRKWPVSALSFGQKKRVTIASVLVMNPQIIILDEPTAGQDFHHYTDIMEFLRGLNKAGVTVLMVTHDMHLMQEYTHRALVFSNKRLLHDGTAVEALTQPELVQAASLKETSLFELAQKCGIQPAETFVQRFIDFDRQVRENE
ncbi:MAG: ABC transporter ATP-binding protein [Candidatus Fournierella pullistercoris]|uniref:ABC transporter ATP-binding protein n=1 Tax=Candidatus Allofournierella pullistercoris TaxID=2838597 RepID=A0A948T138_9FIRM|nr:ABC transporter ATP-binding protein [Candidatus Fournierella pullistercoris]